MGKRSIIWLVGVVLILVGGGYGWHAWVEWDTIIPPGVAVLKPFVPDPDAPDVYEVEYVAPGRTDTLEDVVRAVDSVLVVRLVTDRTEQVDSGPMWHTIYTFDILDAIKGGFHAGDRVRIARIGGRHSFETGFPRPGLGETFVFFLQWRPALGAYENAYGPETTFRIVQGTIQPMGRHFRTHAGRKAEDFVQQLRKVAPKP